MKKTLAIIAIVMLASLSVVGCLNNTNTTSSPTLSSTAAPLVSSKAGTAATSTKAATPTPVVIPPNAVVKTATFGQLITHNGLTITVSNFGKSAPPSNGLPPEVFDYVSYSYSVTGHYQYDGLNEPTDVITMSNGTQSSFISAILAPSHSLSSPGAYSSDISSSGNVTQTVPKGSTPVSLEIIYRPSSDATYVYKWQL